jgi:hypothetical protein
MRRHVLHPSHLPSLLQHLVQSRMAQRIFSGRYPNCGKQFGLRLNLIAGLLNRFLGVEPS